MSRLAVPSRALRSLAAPTPVSVLTVDEYCRKTGVNPDVMLLDIEGFEIQALRGAAGTIRNRGKALTIVVEMHPNVWESAGTTRESAEGLLAELGRRPVGLCGQRDPLSDHGQVFLEAV